MTKGRGRSVLDPRVVAELTLVRNGVKNPQPLTRVDIIAAYIPNRRDRVPGPGVVSAVSGTNNDNIAGHQRGGMQGNFGRLHIHRLVIFKPQIDRTLLAEARVGNT